MTNEQLLLKDIEAINNRYAAVRKLQEESGVLYNVFNVLGLTYSEVGLHSTLIASLLRPGSHGAGTKFLEAFLKIPALKLPDGYLDIEKTIVETEKYIGTKRENTGGRIDIFLSDGNNCIIIENKIYAVDQEKQLLRYHNYKPNGKLVYLSLFDDGKPSEKSLGGLDPDSVICISYKYDIVQWLKNCVQIAANLPYIREIINQYIRTIQQLTDSDMSTNKEIIDLLRKPENLSAAFAIKDNLNETMNVIMNRFVEELATELDKAEIPFRCSYKEANWFESYVGISFKHEQWTRVKLAIEFEASGLRNMILGINRINSNEDIRQNEAAAEYAKNAGFNRKNESWFWGAPPQYIPTYWNNAEVMKMLVDGSMIKLFIKMLEQMSAHSKDLVL